MLVSELHGKDRGCLVTTVGLASDPSTLLPGETVLWAGRPAARWIRPPVTGAALVQAASGFVLALVGWISLRGTPTLFDVGLARAAAARSSAPPTGGVRSRAATSVLA